MKRIAKYAIRLLGYLIRIIAGNNTQTILFWPLFKNREELTDQLYRLSWYLPQRKNRSIKVFHTLGNTYNPDELLAVDQRPAYMHSMPINLENVSFLNTDNRLERIKAYLCCLYHTTKGNYLLEWRRQKTFSTRFLRLTQQVVIIDHTIRSYRSDVNYVTLQDRLDDYSELIQNKIESKELFNSLMLDLRKKYSKTYIFGRGPSLQKVFELDLSDGACIVVNQTVSNEILIKHINPDIIIGGDHCWNYGCSKLSERFRQDAISWVEKHDAFFVVPLDAYSLMLAHFPKLSGRLIGIPYGAADHNLDLSSDFQTKGSLGVFFEFLFPIACTIGNEIDMLGFDGNDVKPGEERDFKVPFSHYQKADYPDEIIQTIHDSRPGYYDKDQTGFRDEYDKEFSGIIESAEARNFIIKTLAPSFHTALEGKYIN
jgi:hypothetical protein